MKDDGTFLAAYDIYIVKSLVHAWMGVEKEEVRQSGSFVSSFVVPHRRRRWEGDHLLLLFLSPYCVE